MTHRDKQSIHDFNVAHERADRDSRTARGREAILGEWMVPTVNPWKTGERFYVTMTADGALVHQREAEYEVERFAASLANEWRNRR